MYWFDLRQQFGVPGIVLAAIGFCYVLWRWPRRGVLLLLLYAANMAFAWTYNVGDAYIFFLPSHYVVALCAGAGIAAVAAVLSRVSTRTARHCRGCAASALSGLARLRHVSSRRSELGPPRRATARRVHVASHDPAIRPVWQTPSIGVDTNWQVQNAFEYFMRERRPGIPWFTTDELEWLEHGDVGERFNDFVDAQSARSAAT